MLCLLIAISSCTSKPAANTESSPFTKYANLFFKRELPFVVLEDSIPFYSEYLPSGVELQKNRYFEINGEFSQFLPIPNRLGENITYRHFAIYSLRIKKKFTTLLVNREVNYPENFSNPTVIELVLCNYSSEGKLIDNMIFAANAIWVEGGYEYEQYGWLEKDGTIQTQLWEFIGNPKSKKTEKIFHIDEEGHFVCTSSQTEVGCIEQSNDGKWNLVKCN
jgi:hypothetical protein